MTHYKNTTKVTSQTGQTVNIRNGGGGLGSGSSGSSGGSFWDDVSDILDGGGSDGPPSTNTGANDPNRDGVPGGVDDDQADIGNQVVVTGVASDSEPVRGSTHTVTVNISKVFFADPGTVELTMTVDGNPVGTALFYGVEPGQGATVNVTYPVPNAGSYTMGFQGQAFTKTYETVADPGAGNGSNNGNNNGNGNGQGIGTGSALLLGGGVVAAVAVAGYGGQ